MDERHARSISILACAFEGRPHPPVIRLLTSHNPEVINNRGCGPLTCMRMRYVRSLTEAEWDKVVTALKRGPTPEQVEAMRVAKERTDHLFPNRGEDRTGS